LEFFCAVYYLDILEFEKDDDYPPPLPSISLLEKVGLTDDSPVPSKPAARAALWNYCCDVAGGSQQTFW
jgi:hypothetical protein